MSNDQQVFIIDDDKGVRDSLAFLLKTVGLKAVLYESADDFIKDLDSGLTGVLVLDVRMPGMSGLELQQYLIDQDYNLPIVFITGHGDVPMAVEAMKKGAIDFIQKPFRDQELLDRIQQALRNNQQQQEADVEILQVKKQISSLTKREKMVMDLVVEGLANKSIADKLSLSQRTVELHRAHVMEKMASNSVAQLVKKVLKAQDN